MWEIAVTRRCACGGFLCLCLLASVLLRQTGGFGHGYGYFGHVAQFLKLESRLGPAGAVDAGGDSDSEAASAAWWEASSQCGEVSKLMPLCERCIPGLELKSKEMGKEGEGGSPCRLSAATNATRAQLVDAGACEPPEPRPPGSRVSVFQRRLRELLMELKPRRVLSLGSLGALNLNRRFLMAHCPDIVTVLDPCGEMSYVSMQSPCHGTENSTLVHVMPISLANFTRDPRSQHHDAIVCMGCERPTWDELMTMMRPFYVLLEFESPGFSAEYPLAAAMGCELKQSQGLEEASGSSLRVLDCGELPQRNRSEEVLRLLRPWCTHARPQSYRGMACQSEKLMLSKGINDTAFMAIDALTSNETDEEKMLEKLLKKQNKRVRPPPALCRLEKHETARANWSNETQPQRFQEISRLLHSAATAEEAGDFWEALCFAGSVRHLLSGYFLQADVRERLWSTVRNYHRILRKAIQKSESESHSEVDLMAGNYRFRMKRCPANLDTSYFSEVAEMEPILSSGRNIEFREFNELISFNPYLPLMSFKTVQRRTYKRRIMVDAGANGFLASPKQLIDMVSAYVPFDLVVMFEPDISGMSLIPRVYKETMNITFHRQYIQVGTRQVENDVISWITANVEKDDFFVLKFDVDEGQIGPTMEWGFLADLIYSDALGLVDELFIELHYHSARLRWGHQVHSERQRYDVIRQLRACGMPVHDWP